MRRAARCPGEGGGCWLGGCWVPGGAPDAHCVIHCCMGEPQCLAMGVDVGAGSPWVRRGVGLSCLQQLQLLHGFYRHVLSLFAEVLI